MGNIRALCFRRKSVQRRTIQTLLAVLCLLLCTIACDPVDKEVLSQLRTYFPNAEIVPHQDQSGIEIETNVRVGIGPKLCEELFKVVNSMEQFKKFKSFWMPLVGYNWIAIRLGDYTIAYIRQSPDRFWVLQRSQAEMPNWWNTVPPVLFDGSASASQLNQSRQSTQAEQRMAAIGAVIGIISRATRKTAKEDSKSPATTFEKQEAPKAIPDEERPPRLTRSRPASSPPPSEEKPAASLQKATVICGDSVAPVPITSDSTAARKSLNCGEQVIILSRTGAWTRIRTRDGVEGYVSSKNLE